MTPLLCIHFLLLVYGINCLTPQHTKYHIATIYVPNTNNKHSKICAHNKLSIKSVSFNNLYELNIPVNLHVIEPHVTIQYNQYYQYTLQKTIHFLPTQIDNITMDIHIKDDETRICSPNYVILPIVNNDMKLKCALNQWNAASSTIIYHCHVISTLISAPSTTIFYAMDKEYKSALARYDQQRRRLFNDINATQDRAYLQLHQSENTQNKLNWILIGALTVFIPLSCCVFGICCIKKKKEKNSNKLPSNQTNVEITDEHDSDDTVLPILCSSPDHQILSDDDEVAIVQMTNITHESEGSSSSSHIKNREKMTNIAHESEESSSSSTDNGKCKILSQNGEKILPLKKRIRIDTDSFDTNTSCTTDEEYEGDGYDVDHLRLPFQSSTYMKVLPDDDECDLYELETRRDSGDIDHDKLESNSWGTSLALHEGGLFRNKEELNQYTFFYQPQAKKKKRKKEKFKVRIKEDTMHGIEIENDVINQMITDSEMSEC